MALVTVAGAVTGVAAGGEVVKTPKSRYVTLGGKYRCPIVILRSTKAGVVLFAMMLFIVLVRDSLVRLLNGNVPWEIANRPNFRRGAMIVMSTV